MFSQPSAKYAADGSDKGKLISSVHTRVIAIANQQCFTELDIYSGTSESVYRDFINKANTESAYLAQTIILEDIIDHYSTEHSKRQVGSEISRMRITLDQKDSISAFRNAKLTTEYC